MDRESLGPYEILEPLGSGGMGDVYRAHDPNLRRDVAIKVLPVELAADPDRLARLEREAHSLAALNHPNVATIHGLEQAETGDGSPSRFLVLELIDGETLEERLRSGPIEVEEALEIAVQIARGLEAAHDKGIVHRDLKPGNVKITPDGLVKVLDFGLAKPSEVREDGEGASEGTGEGGDEEGLTRSPTVTVAGTEAGVILGTAAYMSPEQARGKPIDKRTDIWSFGCVLYELFTGRRPFVGDDVQEILAAVLRDEPDWEALRATVPFTVRHVARRCLCKDPDRRLHDIADARIEIEEALADPDAGPAVAVVAEEKASIWSAIAPWAVAGLTVLVAMVAIYRGATVPTPALLQVLALPHDADFDFERHMNHPPAFAISPDGNSVVYRVEKPSGLQLYSKRMDELAGVPIRGTESANRGFFMSPDGEWIAFADQGQLWRIRADGGERLPVCDLPGGFRGASWGPGGTIVVAGLWSGLARVSAQGGGELETLTELDADRGEQTHRWPHFLPDGGAILFNVWSGGNWDDAEIAVLSLEDEEKKVLPGIRGTYPRYVPTGHLLFARHATLYAVPFDADALEITGTPVPVLPDIAVDSGGMGAAHFAVSDTGTLAYVPPPRVEHEVVLFDREGRREAAGVPSGSYSPWLRFSPDGRYLALADHFDDPDSHLYLHDLQRPRSLSSIASGVSGNESVAWTPDGRLIFSKLAATAYDLFSVPIDGSAPAEPLLESPNYKYASSVSPEGETLLYQEQFSASHWDILAAPLKGGGTPRVLVASSGFDGGGVFAPEGRFFAYHSNETGEYQVYVRPFPDHDAWRRPISTDGGGAPVWGPDGTELFYLQDRRLMAVSISTEPEFSAQAPRPLFEIEGDVVAGGAWGASYDIAPDSERFVFLRRTREPTPSLHLSLNWFPELERLVSEGQ